MKNMRFFVGVVGVLVLCGACKNPFFPALESPLADPEVPVISVQPEGAEYFIGDEAADLTVTALVGDKGRLSYQWYRTTEDSNEEGTLIDGETEASYTPDVDTAGIVYYYVVVTNTLNKKTAVAVSDTAAVTVYEIEEGTTVIDSAAVIVTAPAKGSTPDATATVDGAGFSCGEVSWNPGDNPFLGGTVYTATVTLTADDGYAFAPGLAATINHRHAVVSHNAIHAVTLSLAFDATLTKTVTGIAIKDQPVKLIYTHGDTLDLSGLAITLTHDDTTSEDVALAGFGTSILTEPEDGAMLSHTGHDGQPVAVLFGGFTAHTANLTVNRAAVSSVEVTVTGPTKGSTPHTTATADGAGYTCGEVSWSPEHNPFLGGTVYTASVTLTAVEGYTFASALAAATINGNDAAVSNNTGTTVTLSFEFAATNTRTVTAIAVKTQPANLIYTHGDTLDLSGLVVTLTHDDNTAEDAALADFVSNNISESPANGAVLHHSTHNAQPIAVSYGELTANTNTLTVNAKALTVTGAAHTRPYDGTTTATGVTVTLPGIIGGEDVTAGTVTAEYTNANAGTQTVNITSVTLAGTAAGNYTVTLPANNVTVTGGITKANPAVTWPTAAAVTYGAALSTSALTGGVGAGTFAWTDGAIIPTVTNSGYEVTFTPNDSTNYNTLTQNVGITVSKANPTVTWPTAAVITYGAALSTSALSGGVGDGMFAWADGAIIPTVTNSGYEVTFTPDDSANYNTLSQNVSITVNKADPSVTWPTGLTAAYGQTLADISLPGNGTSSPAGTFTWTTPSDSVGALGTQSHNMTFTPTDAANYNTVMSDVNIHVRLIEMVRVEGGTFQMGQNGDGSTGNVTPVHTVTLTQDFSIGKYEVTQEQYEAVMGTNPSYFKTSADAGETQNRRPVEMVSWYEALVFCNKLSVLEGLTPAYSIEGSTDPAAWGTVPTTSWNASSPWNSAEILEDSNGYRLPTEAQWEYAAKGGPLSNGYIYSGSDDVEDVAWYADDYTEKTHEVGKKFPNELGIHDMSGNVYEWCWDWYGSYSGGAQSDPVGAPSGSARVLRGGSWEFSDTSARSAYRNGNYPNDRYYIIGFRLLCP